MNKNRLEAFSDGVLVMLLAALAYWLLIKMLINANGRDSLVARLTHHDWKLYVSTSIFRIGLVMTLIQPLSGLLSVIIGNLIWFWPNKIIERHIVN